VTSKTRLESEEGASRLDRLIHFSTTSKALRAMDTAIRYAPALNRVKSHQKTLEAAMSINARLLDFFIIIIINSLYPHTLVCKPGRTLKQTYQQSLSEFLESFLRGWICGRFATTD
jgi:hypothetical protein